MMRLIRLSGLFCASLLFSVPKPQVSDVLDAKKTADKRIALPNSFVGNAWCQLMLQTLESASTTAIADGIIKAAKTVNTNNSASEQARQIENLILVVFDDIATAPASTKYRTTSSPWASR